MSRAEPGVVYAGTKPPRLYVSRDRGAHWAELDAFCRAVRWRWISPAEPPYRSYVQGIALSPTDPRVIVAGIEVGAVVRSADGGRSWSGHCPGALRDCHAVAWHASDGRWVYEGGGMGGGAAYSRDGGVSWTPARRGLDGHYGWAVAADPERPEVWYLSVAPNPQQAHRAGNAQAHIYRFVGGEGWCKLAGGLPEPIPHMPYAHVTDPHAPGHLYAGLSNGDVWHTAIRGFVPTLVPAALLSALMLFLPLAFFVVHGSLSYRLRELLVFAVSTLVVSNVFESMRRVKPLRTLRAWSGVCRICMPYAAKSRFCPAWARGLAPAAQYTRRRWRRWAGARGQEPTDARRVEPLPDRGYGPGYNCGTA